MFQKRKVGKTIDFIIEIFGILGKYSLYIYLWHMMILEMLLKRGVLTRPDMNFGEKLIINCFILYFPCLFYILYKKGIKKIGF